MMSIREIKPGVFEVVVYGRKRADGTRPRQTERVHGTPTDAGKVETRLKAKRDEGQPIGPTDAMSAVLAAWLESREHEVSPQTFHNYGASINRYILPHLGKLKLSEVTPDDVRAMDRKLAKAGLAGATRLYAYRVLSMVLRRAVQDRKIAWSPCEPVKPPRRDSPEPQSLSAEEVLELLERLKGSALFLPALLAFDTGMRREELLALLWSDVDLDEGTVYVHRAVEQVGANVRVKEPKTPRSKRYVKLSAPAVSALEEHRKAQAAHYLRYFRVWRDEGLVFPSLHYHDAEHPVGRLWTPYAFSKAWRMAVTAANERRLGEFVLAGGEVADFEPWEFGIHRLRHTFITHQLRAGTRLEVVSRAAGHSGSNVTLKLYSHVLDGEEAATAVVTGKVLDKLRSDADK
jgi:integrase